IAVGQGAHAKRQARPVSCPCPRGCATKLRRSLAPRLPTRQMARSRGRLRARLLGHPAEGGILLREVDGGYALPFPMSPPRARGSRRRPSAGRDSDPALPRVNPCARRPIRGRQRAMNLGLAQQAIAALNPDRECIVTPTRRLTYAQVAERARRL